MSKNKPTKFKPLSRGDSLAVRVELEDWILIEGSAEALSQLATEILALARGTIQSLTMDHPGPLLADNSQFGLIVVRTPKAARRRRGQTSANPADQ